MTPLAVTTIGGLSMLPATAIDALLPGLPFVQRDLSATAGEAQDSLAAFIGAFGLGQLAVGPLMDRFGRRPILLASLASFLVLSVACAFAQNIDALIVMRGLQGLVASAASVGARAIAQDIAATPSESLRIQSIATTLGNLGPLLGPLLGSAIVAFASWRWILGALAIAGALLLALAAALPETLRADVERPAFRPLPALRRRNVRAGIGAVFFAFAGYFALITSAPIALEGEWHLGVGVFAAAFSLNALAAIAGSALAGAIARRSDAERLLRLGLWTLAIGAAAGGVASFTGAPLAYVAGFTAYGAMFGFVTPAAFAVALRNGEGDTGLVAGIAGAALSVGGALGAALCGVIPLPIGMAAPVIAAFAALGAALAVEVLRGTRNVPSSA
jgi:DHA1 family bicyclomycin/chloramphenicol resistance-like MFS transporter